MLTLVEVMSLLETTDVQFLYLIRHLLSNSHDFITVLDSECVIKFTNKSPFGDSADLVGKKAHDFIYEGDKHDFIANLKQAYHNDKSIMDFFCHDISGLSYKCRASRLGNCIFVFYHPQKPPVGLDEKPPSPRHILTPREREIHKLVTSGLSSKQIADRLHISKSTVDRHRENIKKKL